MFSHAVNNTFFFFNSSLHGKMFIYLQILYSQNYILYALFLLHGSGFKYKQDVGIMIQAKVQSFQVSVKLGQSTYKTHLYFKFKVERLLVFFKRLLNSSAASQFYNLGALRFYMYVYRIMVLFVKNTEDIYSKPKQFNLVQGDSVP